MSFYYYSVCNFCKTYNCDLKRCSSCKLLSYCSKEHQLNDWPNHKNLCKILTKSNMNYIKCKSFKEFVEFKINMSIEWMQQLKRPLNVGENQLWMFYRTCSVCFSNKDLFGCPDCDQVAYCSKEHFDLDQNHKYYCKSLKLAMKIDCFTYTQGLPTFNLTNNIKPFDEPPKSIHQYLDLLNLENSDEITTILNAEHISAAATIIHSLKNTKSLTNLTIHMIGSSSYELSLNWPQISECLFHWLNNLRNLNIHLIGPELDLHNPINLKKDLCGGCIKKCKNSDLFYHKNCYQNIVHELDKPSLIIAFNSGLHEFENSNSDTWELGILSFLQHTDTIILLTAYTEEEIVKDIRRLKKIEPSVEVIICERNPFSSLRPLRDWNSEKLPVFYVNQYCAILRR